MKWRGGRRSSNVEDRRGGVGRRVARGGGGLGLIAIIAVAIGFIFPESRAFIQPILSALQGGQGGALSGPVATSGGGKQDDVREFVEVTLGYTEAFWKQAFESGRVGSAGRYQPATLVLFDGRTSSPCGTASAQTGPFYCPADQKIYIDPAFYEVMARQLRAPGDFAQAYVIAHEVAHHVQMRLGLLMEVNRRRASLGTVEGNRLTVRLELQADCFSGAWARALDESDLLERGDREEALRAAFQVGDDVIMRMSGRRVDESKFTHGSGEQRRRWFQSGYDSGDVRSCDTFTPAFERL